MIAKFCSAKAKPTVMANYLLNDRLDDHTAQCIYGDKNVWLNKMRGFKANHPYLSFVYAFSGIVLGTIGGWLYYQICGMTVTKWLDSVHLIKGNI